MTPMMEILWQLWHKLDMKADILTYWHVRTEYSILEVEFGELEIGEGQEAPTQIWEKSEGEERGHMA